MSPRTEYGGNQHAAGTRLAMNKKEIDISMIARIDESRGTIEEANTLEGFIFPVEYLENSPSGVHNIEDGGTN